MQGSFLDMLNDISSSRIVKQLPRSNSQGAKPDNIPNNSTRVAKANKGDPSAAQLTNQVRQLKEHNASLKLKLNNIQTEQADLDQVRENYRTQIAGLTNKIQRLEAELAANKKKPVVKTDFYSKSMIQTLKAEVTELKLKNKELEEALEFQKQKADHFELNSNSCAIDRNNESPKVPALNINKKEASGPLDLVVELDKIEKMVITYREQQNYRISRMDEEACLLNSLVNLKINKLKELLN